MCCCPSSHLHAGFSLPDYFCVYALRAPARHEPGTSRSRAVNSSTDWSSQGRPAGKSLPGSGTTASRSRQPCPRQALALGWLHPLRTRLGRTGWTGSDTGPPWAGLDSPGHSRGFLQRLRDRSGTLTKAPVEMNKGVCREGFICQCKKANAQIPPLKCMTGHLRMAPNWMPHFSVLTTQRYLVRAEKADF